MWIPVSERLPEECKEVLVTVKDDSADSPIYYTAVGWYYAGIWVVEDTVCHQVIAWMRPPKPYKEGGERWYEMKITKEYIDDTVVCIIRDITDGIWDTILADNDKRKSDDLMARLMEICGVMYLADELKSVVDE